MHSPSLTHYPIQIYRDGEKRLRNPITKAHFKNLPEERVRLKTIEFLRHNLNWSLNRISAETGINLDHRDHKSRADIICYDNNFKPKVLVECKAEHISLDAAVALQISQYNTDVEADYLLITNGITDHWFDIKNSDQVLESIPFELNPFNGYDQWAYWTERGFCGSQMKVSLDEWILGELIQLYQTSVTPENIHYFSFDGAPAEFHLQGYYKVIPYSQKHRFAFAFCSTPNGGTRLNVVYNKEGKNKAILSVDLNLIQKSEPSNSLLYSDNGFSSIDLMPIFSEGFDYSIQDKLEELYNFILSQS